VSDSFGKFAGTALEKAVDGGAQVLGNAIAGPGGGVVASIAVGTASAWLRAKSSRNDEVLQEARLAAIEDQFHQLDARMRELEDERARQGVAEEPPDILREEAVFSEFAKAVSRAKTPEKRIALVNAAAHQFDPRMGRRESRDFWLQKISSLSELELAFIAIVADKPVCFVASEMFQFDPGAPEPREAHELPGIVPADVVAFTAVGWELSSAPSPNAMYLVRKSGAPNVRFKGQMLTPEAYWLTAAGVVLAQYMKA